jgi:hypothetical protein
MKEREWPCLSIEWVARRTVNANFYREEAQWWEMAVGHLGENGGAILGKEKVLTQ